MLGTWGFGRNWLSSGDSSSLGSGSYIRKGLPAVLTKLTVRNFKCFKELDIDLESPVIFVGPNNSGKTSAMQALALWDIGLRRWNERYSGKTIPTKRPGVTINRRDPVTIPVPSANHLWLKRKTRRGIGTAALQHTDNIRIEVTVEGITSDTAWMCGLEFDYANPESFYCRPLRIKQNGSFGQMPIPREAQSVKIAYLPPMSGLIATEPRLERGAINVRIGEGRTAEVLRNLCFAIYQRDAERWKSVVSLIKQSFGCTLEEPQYIMQRGEISMSYSESGARFDLSSSGRGLQQTLLLLAYMYNNPNSVILLDEPDAHLEILRQRHTYRLITEVASEQGSQIIAATHSEALLNEAIDRNMVIAFLDTPHRTEDQGSKLRKLFNEIGFEDYIQAEQMRWVLYLKDSADLSILQEFAKVLNHNDAQTALQRSFVHYTGNHQRKSEHHYYGLRGVLHELRGVALFDHIESDTVESDALEYLTWNRRNIENHICNVRSLESFAKAPQGVHGSVFTDSKGEHRLDIMKESIQEIANAMKTLGKCSPGDPESHVSDDFLAPLFKRYFETLGLPNLMRKGSFHKLVRHMSVDDISPEVVEKLDAIARVARAANPNS